MVSQQRRMWASRPVDSDASRTSVDRILSMLTRSLQQCRGCRLTWFPQPGAGAACPACGGTKVGGTPELFHAGIALVAVGLTGWFLRHGPLGEHSTAPVAAVVQSTRLVAKVEPANPVYVSSTKVKPARVKPVAVKRTTVKPTKVSKVKASKVKRRPKKAKTRSNHVQR
jgi:hypothetical protein